MASQAAAEKPALVCPAGSLRALQSAVDAGADAVYLGLKDATNARNFAGLNFDDPQVREGVRYAHARGRQVLMALNTPFFERALVMEGDTEYGVFLKNTLDAIGPLWR